MYIIGDKDKERTKTIKAITIIRRGELTPFDTTPERQKDIRGDCFVTPLRSVPRNDVWGKGEIASSLRSQ